MQLQALISAPQLLEALGQGADLIVLDTQFDLQNTRAGREAYLAGHIPGAHYAHLERDLSAPPTGQNGRHPLPEFSTWRQTAACWGIHPASRVVIYDAHGGMFAARARWMILQLGCTDVAVLDGGLQAWQAIGGPIQQSLPTAPPQPTPQFSPHAWHRIIQAPELLPALDQLFVLDARAPERYRGDIEPLDSVAGHIPGAHNRFFKANLTPEGRFKPAQQLRAEFEGLLGDASPQAVVHQCGSGVTACHNWLAMEVAGLEGSRLYPGSWSEWCSNPERPVAIGQQTN
jgi:thiosulfate/3-mercaptopyruvate sulfurtransferase